MFDLTQSSKDSAEPLPPLWGKVGMGGAAARSVGVDLSNDHLSDAIDVAQHFIVPEAQHTVALAEHEIIAPRIVGTRFSVLAAI